MGKSVIAGANIGGNVSTAATTQFFPLCGEVVLEAAETTTVSGTANGQDVMRSPGTFSQLYIRLTANTCTSLTFTFRKNAGNGNQTISVPSSSGAVAVLDSTHIDTVAAGDKVDIQSVPSSTGTFTQTLVGLCFDSSGGNTVSRIGSHGASNGLTTAASFFVAGGNIQTNYTTEADQKQTQEIAGTFKNLGINISANASNASNSATFISRLNGANGALTISLTRGSSTFGWQEDTSHSDSVSAGNQYCLELPTSTLSTGSMSACGWAVDFITTNGYFMLVCGRSGKAFVPSASTTYYQTLSAFPSTNTTESGAQQALNANFIMSNMTVYVASNSASTATTVNFRKNGGNGNQTLSIPSSSGASTVTDSTHTDIVGPTDLCNTSFVTSTSVTSLTLGHITCYGRNLIGRTIAVEFEES